MKRKKETKKGKRERKKEVIRKQGRERERQEAHEQTLTKIYLEKYVLKENKGNKIYNVN